MLAIGSLHALKSDRLAVMCVCVRARAREREIMPVVPSFLCSIGC